MRSLALDLLRGASYYINRFKTVAAAVRVVSLCNDSSESCNKPEPLRPSVTFQIHLWVLQLLLQQRVHQLPQVLEDDADPNGSLEHSCESV